MRLRSLETLSETRDRRSNNRKENKMSSTNALIEYFREKSERECQLKERELALREKDIGKQQKQTDLMEEMIQANKEFQT